MLRGTSAKKPDYSKVPNGSSSRDWSMSMGTKSSNENIPKTETKNKMDTGSSSKGFANPKYMQSSTSSTRGNSVAPSKPSIPVKQSEGPIKANYYVPNQPQPSINNYSDSRNSRPGPMIPAYQQPQILSRNPGGSNTAILRDKTNNSMNSSETYQYKPIQYPYETAKNENKISTLQSKNSFSNDNSRKSDYDINNPREFKVTSGTEYTPYSQTPNPSRFPQVSPKEANREPVGRFTTGGDSKYNGQLSDYRNSDRREERREERPIPPSSNKPTTYLGVGPFHSSTSNTPSQGRDNFVSQIQNDAQPKSIYSYTNKPNGLSESSTKQSNNAYTDSSNLLSQEKQNMQSYSYNKQSYSEYEERKSDREKTVQQHKIIHSPSKDYSQVEPKGLVGLKNIGNTCFM